MLELAYRSLISKAVMIKRGYFIQVVETIIQLLQMFGLINRAKSHTWSFPYFPHQWLSSDTLCQFQKKRTKMDQPQPTKETETGVTASLGLLTMLQQSSFLVFPIH